MSLGVLVLAAGQSKRMKSSVSKIFHDLCGRYVIAHVKDCIDYLNPHKTVYVVSEDGSKHSFFKDKDIQIQTHPLGTGDAIISGLRSLDDSIKDVLIVYGDTPLIKPETLINFCKNDDDFSLIGMDLREKIDLPYGRLILSEDKKHVVEIVEYKDSNNSQRNISIVNTGIYKIKKTLLEDLVFKITNNNKANEFYATDMVSLANGIPITYTVAEFEEFLGINDRVDLSIAFDVLQDRYREKHLRNGVTLLSPKNTFFSFDTIIENDVVVEPFVSIKSGVRIESSATIKSHSVLEKVHIGKECEIGPFAHIRGGSVLKEKSVVGNFVELKNTTFESGAKAKHLSYIGDSKVGEKANIGAGTITANYNGYVKSKTVIQDKVIVGANSTIVAPITIEKNSIIAAGTVVTKDVPKDSLAISRGNTVIKDGWAKTFHSKNS